MIRGILICTILFCPSIWAMQNEAVVIEVRKKVKLHKSEIVYPDYFINGGSAMGLDKGSIVSIVRRVPVHDPFQNASIGDFRIKVADVEIIHSDKDKAIARLVEIDRRAERPMVRYDSIMVGDRLDLKTLRRKVAKVEPFFLPEPNLPVQDPREPASEMKAGEKKPPEEKQPEPVKPLPKKL